MHNGRYQGQETLTTLLGTIFLNYFNDHPNKPITYDDIKKELGKQAAIKCPDLSHLGPKIKTDFMGCVDVQQSGTYQLNRDYQVSDFLETVNDLRKKRELEPLK